MAIRACIVQPLVPRYRVPVFEQLSSLPDLQVEFWADLSGSVGSLQGITSSDRMKLRSAPYRERSGVVWQPAILEAVRGAFDVVVLPWNIRSPHLFLALAKVQRPPIIVWGHGFGTHHERLGGILRRFVAARADGCLFYGQTGLRRVAARGIPSERLFIAPNAIDQVSIQAAIARWSNPSQRWGVIRDRIPLGTPFFLYLSRLEREKRPDLAIEALVAIRRRVPTARLVLIGEGSQRGALERQAFDLGLRDCVVFLGALHDEDQIAPWALCARGLIHPGALGLTIFHAFGYGLPVVTSDAIHLQMPEFEALEPDVNGLTYRHEDAQHLAETCLRLMIDVPLQERMASAARRTVLAEGGRNIPAMVQGIADALRNVARGSR